jgi:bacterioferritin-associated ferredoxin
VGNGAERVATVYVCLCQAVSSATICGLIEAGAGSVEEIATTCGAGTKCGRCQHFIEVMLGARPDCPGPPTLGERRAWSMPNDINMNRSLRH